MKVRLDETLFKARAQENLSMTNDINKLEQVDALVECLDHFVADRKWVDEISRDELLTMVTQSNGDKEVLIESILAKFNTPCIDTKKLKECKKRRQNNKITESMKKRKSLKESDNRDTFTLDTSNTPILNCGLYYTLLGELDPGRYDERFKEFEECVKECAKPILDELVRETPNFEVVSVGNYYHPRYYNYETDSLEFTVKYTGNDLGTVIEEYSNNQDFIDFLQNYKSYDGFISFYADNKDNFVKQDYVKSVSQIIKYNVTEEEYDEANEDLYYDVMDCGFYPEDDFDESLKEDDDKEVEKLDTFDDQMDFLAKDEQEAIDGYKKVINKVSNAKVKAQLKKIETEEKAHKDYLNKVKKNKDLEYTEPLIERKGNKCCKGKCKKANESLERYHYARVLKKLAGRTITEHDLDACAKEIGMNGYRLWNVLKALVDDMYIINGEKHGEEYFKIPTNAYDELPSELKENLKEADNLQTKATKMLSVKKYQIDMAWKNGKTWKTDPMTLDEISKSVGAKVTEKQFVDMMSDNIKSRKDAKNLTKAEIVKLYDYIDGKWKGKDVLWSIKGKTNENLKEELEAGDCVYHPGRDAYYYLKKHNDKSFELYEYRYGHLVEAHPFIIDIGSPFYKQLRLQTKRAMPNLKESWIQFTFEDGSNPYVAKTKEEQDRMFKKYKGRVEQVGDITYLVKNEKKKTNENLKDICGHKKTSKRAK